LKRHINWFRIILLIHQPPGGLVGAIERAALPAGFLILSAIEADDQKFIALGYESVGGTANRLSLVVPGVPGAPGEF
jgi:hypothetical protein